jgi:RNA-directed DNA polymerase
MDKRFWNMLWKWAKRRHPTKSKTWIVKKYWHTKGTRKWVFSTKKNQLKLLADKRIVRHPLIKLDKNPYTDTEYFIERKFKQGSIKLSGKFKTVWKNQKGKCPFCNLLIDIDNGGEVRPLHHKNGNHNDDKTSNLVYAHVHCHRQHHANNPRITVARRGLRDA